MKSVTVLLTASGGLAMTGFMKALQMNREREVNIVCVDVKEQTVAGLICGCYYKVPPARDAKYIPEMLRICEKERIDVVCPNHTDELLVMARNREVFEENGVKIAVSNAESIENAIDKAKAYAVLKENGIPVPEYYLVMNSRAFIDSAYRIGWHGKRVCFKPAKYPHGGGRGFKVIAETEEAESQVYGKPNNLIDWEFLLRFLRRVKSIPPMLVMEYLLGDEYSVYALADKGKMLYCVPNKRERLEGGYSFEAVVEDKPDLCNIVQRIIQIFNFSFNVNVQLRYSNDGEPKVEEINPRMAGTIALPVAAGVNLPYWGVKLALGEEVPHGVKVRYGTRMLRYWSETFV